MNKSFTLIEMLAVILIMGFLSSFIVVHLDSVGGLFKDRKGIAFSNFLKNELLMNLVSEWKLDGDFNDSWLLNNGTMNNFSANPWKTGSDCIIGSCLSFDGEDDWVDCGNDSSLNFYDEITVEAWIKIESERQGVYTCPIIKGLTSWMFYVDSEGNSNRNICWKGRKSDDSGWLFDLKVIYNTNQWFHMTGTFSSSQGFARVYKDGALSKKLEVGLIGQTLYIPADQNLRIGYIWEDGYYLGKIDQIRIYNAALNISQVESNYYAGINNLLINNKLTKSDFIQRVGELNNIITE